MTERGEKVSEIVSRWASATAEVPSNKKKLVTPTKIQRRVEELSENVPKEKTETRGARECREAKEFVDQIQNNQENITSVMKSWNETNKYSNLLDLDKEKKTLEAALKLSKNPPDWSGISKAEDIQYSAAAARYLSTVAMLPQGLAEDPNVVFQLTAKFAASMSENPTCRAEEIKILDQAILHVRQLRDVHPETGFTLNNEDLTYTLRGCVFYDEILDPVTNVPHLREFLEEIQQTQNIRGNIVSERAAKEFEDIGKSIADGTAIELNERGGQKKYKIQKTELKKYVERANRKARELRKNADFERDEKHVEKSAHMHYEDIKNGIPEDERMHDAERSGDIFEFRRDIWDDEQIKRLIEEGAEGEDAVFYTFIEEIDGLGKTHERPSLPEEYFWEDFKKYIKWKYRENTEAHLAPYEYVWKEHQRLSMVIKNLLFQPGDLKDKIKNLQFLTQADFDHFVHNYKWAGDATQLYEEVIFDLLADRRAKYDQALSYLTNASGGHKPPIEEYQDLRAWRGKGSTVSNEEIEARLRKRISELSDEQIKQAKKDIVNDKNKRFNLLQEQVDIVGSGVMLWDTDIQNNAEIQFEIINMNKELDFLNKKKELGETLSTWEKEQLETLQQRIEYKRKNILERGTTGTEGINREAAETRELSPIDLEVKKRLTLLLKSRGLNIDQIPEWQIRRAIWASRQLMIGSGRMISICSTLVTRPAYEFKDIYKVDIGKYVMRSPAFEDLQRIINPDMFQDRFTTASESGNIFRANTVIGFLEQKGFKFDKERKYQRDSESKLNPEIRKSREFLRQVRAETGIPYTETIIQGLFQSGGMFDKSLWRGELTVIDAIRKHRESMGLPPDAQLENQAIGIRIALANKPEEKRVLLDKLVERNPGKLMQMLGEPLDQILREAHFSDDQAKILKRALSLSTVRVSQERKLFTRELHLMSNREDFDLVIKPLLLEQGMTSAEVIKSFEILSKLKNEFVKTRSGYQYPSMIEAWANTDFPLTIALSDINWEEVNFSIMGTAGPDRRGRDLFNMSQARDAWGKLEDPALLYNKEPKEVLKIIKEFRSAMNNYTSGAAAESMTFELVKTWIDMNKNKRTVSVLDPTMWIPFADTIMKSAGGWNVGWFDKMMKKIGFRAWKENSNAGQEFLRKNITGNLSYATRFTGPNGNAWEEKEIDKIIDDLLGMGIFNTNEASYLKLRNQKRAGLPRQVFGLIRKNWWLVPLITTIMAAKTSIDEDKKH